MHCSSISTKFAGFASLLILLLTGGMTLSRQASGQALAGGAAALPAVPYWWSPERLGDVDLLPLLWFNEIDGGHDVFGNSACCVVGVAGRSELGLATVWFGIGFGLEGGGGQPVAIEAAVHMKNGFFSYRQLHGRNGFGGGYQLVSGPNPESASFILGLEADWLSDGRYLGTLITFDCPSNSSSAPCEEEPIPYTWSEGRDHAVTGQLDWGGGVTGSPRFRATTAIGLKVFGGQHEYLRTELESQLRGSFGTTDWWARAAGGWVSNDVPQQRRFLLEGVEPIVRWLNPYLDARGALLEDVPYFVKGGPYLRAYSETRPLVKSYLGLAGELSRRARLESGVWGRIGVFAEAAWTPGIPDIVGPADITPDADFLFEWEKLPAGEGEELGQFRASALEISELWGDAGISLTGGYSHVAVTVSLPLWVSEPAFATEPEKNAFALRWALTIEFFPGQDVTP